MKKYYTPMLFMLVASLLSCTAQKSTTEESKTDDRTQVFNFNDSCKHLIVSLSLEIPVGNDSISMQIRDSLIADFVRGASEPYYTEDGSIGIKPYPGDMNDIQALVAHYGKADYDTLLKMAVSDYEDRMQYLKEDTTQTEEERSTIMEDVPQWNFDLCTKKIVDNPAFVVYSSQAYIYMGGAHGGVMGAGGMTFDKSTGCQIERFVEENATAAIQPMIRKGLMQYYYEYGDTISDRELTERLLIGDKTIPLPQYPEYPNETGDSLTFTYGQYEIASYADGMPSFKIAVKDLKQHLTSAGKALLLKEED